MQFFNQLSQSDDKHLSNRKQTGQHILITQTDRVIVREPQAHARHEANHGLRLGRCV